MNYEIEKTKEEELCNEQIEYVVSVGVMSIVHKKKSI